MAQGVVAKPLTRPQRAALILEGTAAGVSLVMLVWLLLWLWPRPETRPVAIVRVAYPNLGTPVLPYQAEDAQRVGATSKDAVPGPSAVSSVLADLADRLRSRPSGPVVLYLSAVGVSDTGGPLLLPPDGAFAGSGHGQAVEFKRVLTTLAANPYQPKLLVLDTSQVGSDRNLGVFGNGFLAQVQAMLKEMPADQKPKNLAILCSSAPGQVSWPMPGKSQTVFGYYLAKGLAGDAKPWGRSRRLTVAGLYRYVQAHVAKWVTDHVPGAVQTPILLLSADGLDFPLKETRKDPDAVAEQEKLKAQENANKKPVDEDDKGPWKFVEQAWTRRDELAALVPYRQAPMLWTQYGETLLRAERLMLAGRERESTDLLNEVAGFETQLRERAGGLPWEHAWTVGLASAAGLDPKLKESLTAFDRDLRAALDHLTSRAARPEIAPAEGATPEEPAPGTEPATPPADPKAALPANAPAAKTNGAAATKGQEPAKAASGGGQAGAMGGPANRPARAPVTQQTLDRLKTYPALGRTPAPVVEEQALAWTSLYGRSQLPLTFDGTRGELLRQAWETRLAMETAAARDERGLTWVTPWFRAADSPRRAALDRLFIASPEALEAALADGGRLRNLSAQAGEISAAYSEGLDLLLRVQCELPYLGAWQVFRQARAGRGAQGLGTSSLDEILTAAPALAEVLDKPLPPDALTSADESVAPRTLQSIRSAILRLRRGLDSLTTEFRSRYEQAPSLNARDIDELLSVPLIPAPARARLLTRRRDLAAPAAVIESPTESEHPAEPDPSFGPSALGLAGLEVAMLKLGGALGPDVEKVENALQVARRAWETAPTSAFDEMTALSTSIRTAWSALAARVRDAKDQPGERSNDVLVADRALIDRAARILPITVVAGLPRDVAARRLAEAQRAAYLAWLAGRLLDDGAAAHASLVLDDARGLVETRGIQDLAARIDSARHAKLTLRVDPDSVIDFATEREQRLVRTTLTTSADVGSGTAALILGSDKARDLTIMTVDKGQPAEAPTPAASATIGAVVRDGLAMTIPDGAGRADVSLRIGPSEFLFDADRLTLDPKLYYRGRVVTAESGFKLAWDAIPQPLGVEIRQNYRELRLPKNVVPDQFLDDKHNPRGHGFLHPNQRLAYELHLTNRTKKPMKLIVDQAFESPMFPDEPKFKSEEFTLAPGETNTKLVTGIVDSKHVPVDKPRTMIVTFRNALGPAPPPRSFVFHQMAPRSYLSVSNRMDPITNQFFVRVEHLETDHCTGPVNVVVSINGRRLSSNDMTQGGLSPYGIPRGKGLDFWQIIPPNTPKVIWSVDAEVPEVFKDQTILKAEPKEGEEAGPKL